LYFEAKASSFGPQSSNSKQARGHLLASGPSFSEVLAPLKSCLLCYVVPEDDRQPMCDCLKQLAFELTSKGMAPGRASCHGLAIAKNRLIYTWDIRFRKYAGLTSDEATVLEDIQDNTNPSPLLLVYSDEDCPSEEFRDLYRRALIDKLRARLLCELQPLSENQQHSFSSDELLRKTTDGVFDYLGRARQKSLRLLVQKNLFKRISEYWRSKQYDIDVEGNVLRVRWGSQDQKDLFITWLEDRKVRFDTTRPVEPQMPLLDSLPEPSEYGD
jgi:hypothetical protein